MSEEDTNLFRIRKLEEKTADISDKNDELKKTVDELVVNTKLMNSILTRITDQIEPRIKVIEDDILHLKVEHRTNVVILNAVKWVGGVVTLGALGTAGTFLLRGAGVL